MNTRLCPSVTAAVLMALAFASAMSNALGAELEAPRIVIENKRSAADLTAGPARIEMRFEAADGTEIDVSSFQVLYQFGVFRKDITARVLPYVTLTRSGLRGVAPANLPPGTHTLIVRIRDSQRRMAEQAVKLYVGAPNEAGNARSR
jgi:hypothetical protein